MLDGGADTEFRLAAALLGFNPDDRGCGKYVEYEWGHLRHVIDLYVGDINGQRVLEVGCHVGASMVVLTTLGAEVTGIEINDGYRRLAELNLGQYGRRKQANLILLAGGSPLPFSDSSFNLVCCNSVLEYVSPGDLCFTMKEIGRVLRPGGVLLILGVCRS